MESQVSFLSCPQPLQSQHAGMYSAFQFPSYKTDSYLDSRMVMPRNTNPLNGKTIPMTNESSHYKGPKQLQVRPYVGFYSGAGMSSLDVNDVNTETMLRQGATESSPYLCTNVNEFNNLRFNCLPEYGNPQQVKHIIPPKPSEGGWVRGGENTRDYVRRQRCACK